MIDKRMMYAQGQRVVKSLDGSRPGYRGSDYGDEARGTGAYSSNPNFSGGNANTGSVSQGNQGGGSNTGSGSTDDRSSDLQTYNHNVATNRYNPEQEDLFFGDTPSSVDVRLNPREQIQQAFRDFRPKMPNIPFGIGDLFMRAVNPGGKGALQMFSDFSAQKNRNYFLDEVVRAGRYTLPNGKKLGYGTIGDMTGEELDQVYKNYLADRGSGSIDAYGNPIGGQEDSSGITSIYDARPYQMIQNVEVEDPVQQQNGLFTSRFLQNKTPEERKAIEANMPIRFPNLFT